MQGAVLGGLYKTRQVTQPGRWKSWAVALSGNVLLGIPGTCVPVGLTFLRDCLQWIALDSMRWLLSFLFLKRHGTCSLIGLPLDAWTWNAPLRAFRDAASSSLASPPPTNSSLPRSLTQPCPWLTPTHPSELRSKGTSWGKIFLLARSYMLP